MRGNADERWQTMTKAMRGNAMRGGKVWWERGEAK